MSEQQPQKPVPAPFSPEDMARRRGMDKSELGRHLAPNLS